MASKIIANVVRIRTPYLEVMVLLLLFFGTSSTKNIAHGNVAFMTRVFEKLIMLIAREGNKDGPRLGPGLGIVDGDLVVERVGTDPSEALRQFHIRAVMA